MSLGFVRVLSYRGMIRPWPKADHFIKGRLDIYFYPAAQAFDIYVNKQLADHVLVSQAAVELKKWIEHPSLGRMAV